MISVSYSFSVMHAVVVCKHIGGGVDMCFYKWFIDLWFIDLCGLRVTVCREGYSVL